MPTYEYQCKACGHQLEAFQKMSDPALTDCPKCHQSTLAKQVSATNFQLKGTGWYVTDFRDKGKPKNKTEEGGSNSSDTSSSDKAGTTSKDSSSNSNSQAADKS